MTPVWEGTRANFLPEGKTDMTTTELLRRVSPRHFSDYTPPEADARVRFSLKRILLEGTPSDIALRIMGTFITPFALALKATTPQIGLLTALPYLVGALAQLFTHRLVELAGSRKRFFLVALLSSALVWVPIALLPWVFGSARVWWLLGLVTLAITLFQLPSPAWGSWVSQLLPANRRGRFVGARATLASLVGVVTVLAMGRLLDLMENRLFVGFSLVFFGAMLCRFVSLLLFLRVYEPAMPRESAPSPRLWESLRSLAGSDLGRFMFLNSLFQFSVCLAGPFFAVLMLRDLGFSYTTFSVLEIVSVGASLVGLQVWGRIADRVGNARLLYMTAPLIGLFVLGWIFGQSPVYLAMVNVLTGFAWAGYGIGSLNFALEASGEEDRTRMLGYFNAFAGVGIFLGSLIGGFLAPLMPRIFGYSLLTLIMISGLLRLSTGLLMTLFVREVREGVKPSSRVRFTMPHLRLAPMLFWLIPPHRR